VPAVPGGPKLRAEVPETRGASDKDRRWEVAATRYNWLSWVDGSEWVIHRREHYELETERMRRILYVEAKQRGMKVRTQLLRDGKLEGLKFQFYRSYHIESRESIDDPTGA
jgi:hypothetical protein